MKKLLLLTFSFICLSGFAQVGAIWTGPTSGTINGVSFEITGAENPSIQAYDLSTADYSAGPLGENQNCLDYSGYSDITITLESPIELYIYPKYWRTDTYIFSEAVTFLSGSNLNVIDDYTIDAIQFADGILVSNEPVTSLTITTTFQECCSYQALNFGGPCTPTSNSISVEACGYYDLPSGTATYSVSGIYNDTIPNAAGCDSILTIDLTINTVNLGITYIDDETLLASAANASYEWIDCDNDLVFSEETDQSFMAPFNGNFAAIVTENGCTDTTACLSVIGSSNFELSKQNISIYPNPTQDVLFIEYNFNHSDQIIISDLFGKTVFLTQNNLNRIDVSGLSEGIYLLTIQNEADRQVIRFVKE